MEDVVLVLGFYSIMNESMGGYIVQLIYHHNIMSSPKVFVIGNPLLDISAHVDIELFNKYDIKLGNAILAEEKHLPLYEELVTKYQVEYIPGGAAQNTARVAQWMLNEKQQILYTGCVGTDKNADILKSATEANGVVVKYLADASAPTGACAVMMNNKERSLTTNLGAANNFKVEHLQTDEMKALIDAAELFYMVGYFMTVSPDSAMLLGKHAAEKNKSFLYGLAAPFLIQVDFFWERVKALLPYVDVVFANESEAAVLGERMGWGADLAVIAEKLSVWEKVNSARSRTVVFTQGPNSTLVFQDGKLTQYSPINIAPEDIVDLNAAGDSFCGGFVAAYTLGKEVSKCVEAGHYAASEIIRQNGCSFPSKRSYDL
ncbi:adenosine kinase [Cavenderia fasciculata]|uniref:Adenosine kinase n=1 Tax=Cavenderia fasciculata TaxID=261658 RepID=F4PUU3_CACFS|nr:adenosine kinase [Cavenderia fasciculata]EGG21905.1 adenosine kinase [Cavenderia fasciculata]|eukprot:XP_004359756.1 adenosine kinase [Cavenderia fasciculata]